MSMTRCGGLFATLCTCFIVACLQRHSVPTPSLTAPRECVLEVPDTSAWTRSYVPELQASLLKPTDYALSINATHPILGTRVEWRRSGTLGYRIEVAVMSASVARRDPRVLRDLMYEECDIRASAGSGDAIFYRSGVARVNGQVSVPFVTEVLFSLDSNRVLRFTATALDSAEAIRLRWVAHTLQLRKRS